MKKFMLMAALVALVVSALAIPAMAQDDFFRAGQDRFEEDRADRFDDANDWWNANNWWDNNWWDDNNDVPAISQSFEQEAQSGDVEQTFSVGSLGDNSNQCVGFQGIANTGNNQNAQGAIQYGSDGGDISIGGGTFEISPSSSVSCDQTVQQSAAASSW